MDKRRQNGKEAPGKVKKEATGERLEVLRKKKRRHEGRRFEERRL